MRCGDMMNYIKSELYRIMHSKGIYLLTGICTALLLSMNIMLGYFKGVEHFSYATTEFVFKMVWSALNVVFFLTLCMGGIVFAEEYKNKTIANSVAFGYSRISLYFGKLLTGLIVSVGALAVVLAVFIGSAYLLLENSGIDVLITLLKGIGASVPILVAGEAAALTLLFLAGSSSGATWSWMGIMIGVPIISELLGMKFDFFRKLSGWLAYEVLQNGQQLIMVESETEAGMSVEPQIVLTWMTQAGLTRMLLVGVIGTAVFVIWGIAGLRRREI